MKWISRIVLALTFCVLVPVSSYAAQGKELRRTPVVRVVQNVSPAVVNITSIRTERNSFGIGTGNPFFDRLLEQYGFQDRFPSKQNQRPRTVEQKRSSLGSGVLIDGKRAFVLTNAHVIDGASDIEVRLRDGRSFKAILIGSDPDFDLAVLKLRDARNLPQVKMGDSNDIYIGETVIAIGNPFGFTHTVTTGVVSALNRSVNTKRGTFTDFIQTDTAINPGNSGGPLLNILGELIGVNTAIRAGAEGIGFAIPINKARRVVNELINTGKVAPIWLGLFGQDLDQQMANYLGLKSTNGMIITEICEIGPAVRSGLRAGDVVLSVNGIRIEDKNQYLNVIRNYTKGKTVNLKIYRNGKQFTSEHVASAMSQKTLFTLVQKRWGMTLRANRGNGVIVEAVRAGSPAAKLKLQRGDVVHQVGHDKVNSMEELSRAFLRYRLQNAVILKVQRGRDMYHIRMGI
ncbi:MAG: trypsin-like peptidase domain-containing protein [Desulfovibrio sp.]